MMRRKWNCGRGWGSALLLALSGALGSCGDGQPGKDGDEAEAAVPAKAGAKPPIGKFSGADVSKLAAESLGMPASLGFPSTEVAARSFRRLGDEDKAALEALALRFAAAADSAEAMDLLDQMEAIYAQEILGTVAEALKSPDENLRKHAVDKLRGNISQQILDVLAPALDDESVEVRIAALEAVTQVREPEVIDFIAKGFADNDMSVRQGTLIAIDNLMEDNKIAALDRAMKAPHQEVISLAIGQLQVVGTPYALETIFQGIDSSDPAVQAEARFAVSWLIDQDFETAQAARAWWAEHRGEFDAQLAPKQ